MIFRRLQTVARFCSAIVAVVACAAGAEVAWSTLAPHPRLFADAGRWAGLVQQAANDPVSRQIYAVVKNSAERLLDQPPVAYVDTGAFWHGPMRQAQGRILALAMTFRLTGDARFLARAKLEMRTMAELPNWYPKHFLDTAEGALGLATGLDWLHAALTPEEREQFATALVEKALEPGLLVVEENSWVSGTNNWTAVCHGGLVAAALAVAEREPALAQQVVDRALKHLPRYAELYAPVGAYSEGPDYWAYGTTFYALLAESLRTALGTTAGLERAPGFLKTADYTLQMTAPTGALFNFGDNGSGLGFEPILFWFARELRRADLLQRELANLEVLAGAIAAGAPRGDASRMLPLALIWRDPSLNTTAAAPPLVWWSEGGSQPQAVLRSQWNDPRATFVGIKAGQADDSHAHMDIGSFILEADGVRWAVDLGRESYPHARANGMAADLFKTTQASKRWGIFRCGPESHNLLRFDGAPSVVTAKAEIRPLPLSDDGAPGFAVDLSPVVRGQVARAERHIRLHSDRSVSIDDEWTTLATATNVTWQWLTRAEVTPAPDGVTLRQNGETLRLLITEGRGARCEVEDVSKPRHAWDSPNPGLRRIVIHVAAPAATTGRIRVTATPGASGRR